MVSLSNHLGRLLDGLLASTDWVDCGKELEVGKRGLEERVSAGFGGAVGGPHVGQPIAPFGLLNGRIAGLSTPVESRNAVPRPGTG